MTEPPVTQFQDPPAAGSSLQRALMDRARSHAERDAVKPPRRPVVKIIGLTLALAVVLTIALGFDAFVASMQRVMHVYDQQDKAEAVQRAKEPMPAFVVPDGGQRQDAGQLESRR